MQRWVFSTNEIMTIAIFAALLPSSGCGRKSPKVTATMVTVDEKTVCGAESVFCSVKSTQIAKVGSRSERVTSV
ncbi:hypothetical protein IWZ00DRAFT_508683 [Phyllosticta capitalensis]